MADDFGSGAYYARMGQGSNGATGAHGGGNGGWPLLATVTGVVGKEMNFSLSTEGFSSAKIPSLFGKVENNPNWLPQSLRTNSDAAGILGRPGLIGPAHDVSGPPAPGIPDTVNQTRSLEFA